MYGRGACAEAVPRLQFEHQIFLRAYLMAALVCAGRAPEAREAIEVMKRDRQERYRPAAVIGAGYAALGELDSAFAWMDRAYEDRDSFLIWLRVSPLVDPLRRDPRFDALLRRTWLRRSAP